MIKLDMMTKRNYLCWRWWFGFC